MSQVNDSVIPLALNFGTVAVSIIGAWGSVIWMVRGTVDKVGRNSEQIEALEQICVQTSDKVEDISRMNADSMLALREKIRETELWGRDHFVRRQELDARMAEIRNDLAEIKNLIWKMQM